MITPAQEALEIANEYQRKENLWKDINRQIRKAAISGLKNTTIKITNAEDKKLVLEALLLSGYSCSNWFDNTGRWHLDYRWSIDISWNKVEDKGLI